MRSTRYLALAIIFLYLAIDFIFDLLDFSGVHVPSVKVITTILALAGLWLFLSSIDFTSIFYGTTHRPANKLVVLITFVFSLQFILQTLRLSAKNAYYLALPLQYLTVLAGQNRFLIAGFALVLLVSVYLARLKVKKPSLLEALGEHGKPHALGYAKQFVISTFLVLGLYQLILKPTLEWLTLSTGSLLSHAIAIFLLADLWLHHKLNLKTYLASAEETVKKYYKKFIGLFHSKNHFLFGLSLVAVIIPAVDIGHYVLGYLTGVPNNFYSTLTAQAGHTSWLALMLSEIAGLSAGQALLLTAVYIINAAALITLLLMPLLLWVRMFNRQSLTLPRWASVCFVFIVTTALIAPAFRLIRLESQPLFIGTDIQTLSLAAQPLALAIITALVLSAAAWILWKKAPRAVSAAVITASAAFFAKYVALYYISLWSWLVQTISSFAATRAGAIMSVIFFGMLLVSIVFSMGAIIAYFHALWKNWKATE